MSEPIETDEVFAALERDRGKLGQALRHPGIVYAASISHPGAIEAIHPDGRVQVGHFRDGQFQPDAG